MDYPNGKKAYKPGNKSFSYAQRQIERKIDWYKRQANQATKLMDKAAAAKDAKAYYDAHNKRNSALIQIRKQESLLAEWREIFGTSSEKRQ